MSAPRLPRIVHWQRWRLRLGRSSLTFESKTTIPSNDAAPLQAQLERAKDLARVFAPRWSSALPLVLHLGHRGLGHVMAQLRQRGFVGVGTSVTRQRFRDLRLGHGVMVAAGLLIDAWQVTQAVRRSLAARSLRPVTAQAARSLTTWGAVWAGVELFGVGGALLGLELGPGVVVTTTVGAVLGGCAGLFAGDWVATRIEAAGARPDPLAHDDQHRVQ